MASTLYNRTTRNTPLINSELGRWILSGFAATLAMTIFVYVAPLVGIANIDFAGILGSLLIGNAPEMFSGAWWVGMAWHFLNGSVIFPLAYAYLVRPILSGEASPLLRTEGRRDAYDGEGLVDRPVLKATVWGVFLWLLSQLVAMPIVGGGLFSSQTSQPVMVVIGSLIAHLIYGSVLGAVSARTKSARMFDYTAHDRAA